MSTSLTTQIASRIRTTYTQPLDHGTPRSDEELDCAQSLDDGAASGQANKCFHDQRTLAASASESLDLAGGLTDAFGNTLTFTAIKAIQVKASSSNTNNVVVGGAASNTFTGPFADATDKISIPPGGSILLVAPASGWSVAAGTGDILKVANSAGSTSVTYDIALVGVG